MTHNIDAVIEGRIAHGSTVTVAVTASAESCEATVGWLGGGFHQLRCATALEGAVAGAAITVDGTPGRVLETGVRKHGPTNDLLVRLTRLARGQEPDGD